MSIYNQNPTTTSIRNNRIIRRAIIPANYHHAAKLMAKAFNVPVGEIYDDTSVSQKAHDLAIQLGITEHEVLLTAIYAFAKKHKFDRLKI